MKGALVLLSGGIDSAVCLALATQQHERVITLSFDYGQKHRAELNCAQNLSSAYKAFKQITYPLDPAFFQHSALTNPSIAVPEASPEKGIRSTYVPARNLIFLSLATALCETHNCNVIYYGATKEDLTGFPDCRPEFIKAFQNTMNLATSSKNRTNHYCIKTPLLKLEKHEVITLGAELGIAFENTVTCYQADKQGRACGKCDSCVIRKEGFKRAKLIDTTRYV